MLLEDGGACHCFIAIGWRARVRLFANLLTLLVILIHIMLFIFQIFLFNTVGQGFFNNFNANAAATCGNVASSEGAYNLIFALGLIWGLVLSWFSFGKRAPRWRGWASSKGENIHQRLQAYELKLFFLLAAVAVGVYDGIQVALPVLFFQAIPAAVAFVMVIIGGTGIDN